MSDQVRNPKTGFLTTRLIWVLVSEFRMVLIITTFKGVELEHRESENEVRLTQKGVKSVWYEPHYKKPVFSVPGQIGLKLASITSLTRY